MLPFRDVIPIPRRDLDHNLTRLGNDGLASQTRIQLQVGGSVHAVELVVVSFSEVLRSLFHPNVTRGTGAHAAAGVVEEEVVVHGDVEDRLRFAVVLIRQLAVLVLDSASLGQEGDLNQVLLRNVSGRGRTRFVFSLCHMSYSIG